MAKDLTLKTPDGSTTLYPKTVTDLVFDNESGTPLKEMLVDVDQRILDICHYGLLNPYATADSWALTGINGICAQDSNSKLVKYQVTAGEKLVLSLSKDNAGVCQFQSAASVPGSGTNANLVGSTFVSAVNKVVTVPQGATYLIVSQLKSNTTNIVGKLVEIDEKPTNGSKNIVESGGVFDFSDWQVMPSNNGQSYSDNNIIFNETSVTFGSEGILVASPSGAKYYIARSDRNTETISVDLSFYRAVVYIDKTKLVVNSRVNSIASCIVFVDSWEKNANYIPFLYQISNKFYPIGQFVAIKSIIDANKAIQQISTVDNKIGEIFLSGNNEMLFKRVSVSENKITIKTDGFSVFRKTDSAIKLLGYVGYVSGTDASDTYLIEGDTDTIRYAWFVDLNTLNINNRTAFSVAIKKIVIDTTLNEQTIPSGYLLLATSYRNSVMSPLIQSSLNEDKGGADDVPFNLSIFEPDFYAYLNGRFNNAAGTGQRWYKRFCITHISDVHQYNDLMREALEVSQTKADAIVNTGDNGNGNASTTRTQSQSWLSGTVSLVNGVNGIPYIEAKGNHDVCNITLSDWRSTIGSLINSYSSSFVWGGENVGYGYMDIAGDSDMGSFRIILLDPFDYADGLFPSTRAFQSATFSQAQINWLINTLVYAANNGLHVITAMHYSFGDNSSWSEENARPDAIFYQDPFMIPDIIDAIQNKSVINKTYSDSQNIANITVNENFANVGDLDFVCHLFGHIHSKNEYWCKKSNGSKEYDILMLGEAALGTYGNALNKVYRNPGTVNEIEFSALCVDTIEKTVYRISYGAYKKYDLSNNARSEKFSYRKS